MDVARALSFDDNLYSIIPTEDVDEDIEIKVYFIGLKTTNTSNLETISFNLIFFLLYHMNRNFS